MKQGGYPLSFSKAVPIERRALKQADCIISLKGRPYIVLEFKRLNYGTIDRYGSVVEDVLTKAEYLKAKYAVLTRFGETVVCDGTKRNALIKFNNPSEHLERFDELWQYLSREAANKAS